MYSIHTVPGFLDDRTSLLVTRATHIHHINGKDHAPSSSKHAVHNTHFAAILTANTALPQSSSAVTGNAFH